jgi:hypothetical protein
MKDFDTNRLTAELEEVAVRLREQRAELTPLELDRIKLRAKAGASRPASWIPKKGMAMRARILTLVVACLLFGGTAAGGLAGGSWGGHNDNAGHGQYGCDSNGHGNGHGKGGKNDRCDDSDGGHQGGGGGKDSDRGHGGGGNNSDRGHGGGSWGKRR